MQSPPVGPWPGWTTALTPRDTHWHSHRCDGLTRRPTCVSPRRRPPSLEKRPNTLGGAETDVTAAPKPFHERVIVHAELSELGRAHVPAFEKPLDLVQKVVTCAHDHVL